MNAIIYAKHRVRPRLSVDTQLELCQARCDSAGWTVTGGFCDETQETRRLDAALTAACDEHGILVIHSLSRLGQPGVGIYHVAERLREAGAHLCSVSSPAFDTVRNPGILIFLSELLQVEREWSAGHPAQPGPCTPYGHARDENGLLHAHQGEQATIALIVDRHRTGDSLRKIGAYLTECGIHPRSGPDGSWHTTVVRDILTRQGVWKGKGGD